MDIDVSLQNNRSNLAMPAQQNGLNTIDPSTLSPRQRMSLDIADTINDDDRLPANVQTATFQQRLSAAIGRYVICELLLGVSDDLTIRDGILVEVGNSYFILYNAGSRTQMICDFFSLKFVTILPSTLNLPQLQGGLVNGGFFGPGAVSFPGPAFGGFNPSPNPAPFGNAPLPQQMTPQMNLPQNQNPYRSGGF